MMMRKKLELAGEVVVAACWFGIAVVLTHVLLPEEKKFVGLVEIDGVPDHVYVARTSAELEAYALGLDGETCVPAVFAL